MRPALDRSRTCSDDGRTVRRSVDRSDGRTVGRANERTDGGSDGRMVGRSDGRSDGRTIGRSVGRSDGPTREPHGNPTSHHGYPHDGWRWGEQTKSSDRPSDRHPNMFWASSKDTLGIIQRCLGHHPEMFWASSRDVLGIILTNKIKNCPTSKKTKTHKNH